MMVNRFNPTVILCQLIEVSKRTILRIIWGLPLCSIETNTMINQCYLPRSCNAHFSTLLLIYGSNVSPNNPKHLFGVNKLNLLFIIIYLHSSLIKMDSKELQNKLNKLIKHPDFSRDTSYVTRLLCPSLKWPQEKRNFSLILDMRI